MLRSITRVLRQYGVAPLLNRHLWWEPPGHFYSPVPSQDDARRRAVDVASLPGIDTRDAAQLALAERLAAFMPPPFEDRPTGDLRYGYQNGMFGGADGTVLYAMLRHLQPQRVIEVGSGHSSVAMLDTVDRFFSHRPEFTFIEPYPDRLKALLRPGDRHTILEQPVQDVPVERFLALEANDILFIDSSHVVKVGSDVVHLLRNVVPALQSGVIVHVHDVFWPFEYPQDWIEAGRAWNEAYQLHAFLQFNDAFEILFFPSYLAGRHREILERTMPLTLRSPAASIWLRKTR